MCFMSLRASGTQPSAVTRYDTIRYDTGPSGHRTRPQRVALVRRGAHVTRSTRPARHAHTHRDTTRVRVRRERSLHSPVAHSEPPHAVPLRLLRRPTASPISSRLLPPSLASPSRSRLRAVRASRRSSRSARAVAVAREVRSVLAHARGMSPCETLHDAGLLDRGDVVDALRIDHARQ